MLDEIGAEDLVPPVEGVGGLEEEALVAIVVHEAASNWGEFLGRRGPIIVSTAVDETRGGDRLSWVMTGKTAVERIGSAVVATYVQIQSKEPQVGLRGKLTPEMIPDLAESPGKVEDSASGSGVSFLSWTSAINAY